MIQLQKLSANDGETIFLMLQDIGECENSFSNPVHGMGFSEYGVWLVQQEKWSRGEELPDGYVAQSIYWLFDDDVPVGIGKIRHGLTPASRNIGGNIGYAIASTYRGKGYAKELLRLLLKEARGMELPEILLTVDKYNAASKKVIEENGGQLFSENDERWYFHFI